MKKLQKISKKRQRWGSLAQYKKVCQEIWEERGARCDKCKRILREAKYHNFNHTAGRRENFLNKSTIELVCFSCHSKYHGIETKNADWLDF